MKEEGVGTLVRVFIDAGDRHRGVPLYEAVVGLLRERGIAGATVLRGVEGFGTHRTVHAARFFALMPNAPVVIEAVDTDEAIAAILPEIERLVPEGLITLERVEYRRYRRDDAAPA
jgi:PII-like signaling protein